MITNLLTEAWLAVLSLSAVNESGGFSVKAVQTVGVLVDEGVVLGDELPADFRGIDRRVGGGHDDDATDETTDLE